MTNLHEEQLKRLGADPDVVNQYQILCLPENLLTATNRDELVEAGQTAVVAKLLKAAGVRCALPQDVGFQIRGRVRKSADVWCGLIWIRDYLAAPTFVAVLCSWLTARYISGKGDRCERPRSLRRFTWTYGSPRMIKCPGCSTTVTPSPSFSS